jgi:hypothetical protein
LSNYLSLTTSAGGWCRGVEQANAPEFFLHHANVDRIWNIWQSRSASHATAYINAAIDRPMNNGMTPRAFLNLANQNEGSRNVCVEYVEQSGVVQASVARQVSDDSVADGRQPPSAKELAEPACPDDTTFNSMFRWLRNKGLNNKARLAQRAIVEAVLCDQ